MGRPWPQGESPRGEGRPTSLVQAQYRVPGLQAHKYRPVPGRALPPLATKMSYMPAPEHLATSPGTSKYPHPREGQLWEHIISTLINVLLSSHTLLTRSSYKPLNTLIPQYLSDLLQPYTQSWMLRSCFLSRAPASIPLGTESSGWRPPPSATLPYQLHNAPSLESFKKLLKLTSSPKPSAPL